MDASAASKAAKLNPRSFNNLPRLGSLDAHELNALRSDRERSTRDEGSMDCPKCNEKLLCDHCCRYFKGDPVFKAPGCEKCKKRYEREIEDARTELGDLRAILSNKFSKQINAYEETERKITASLAFLKLPDPDPSSEICKGDVALVIQGFEPIQAHRFILAGKSPVFFKMFEDRLVQKQKTGPISIDDAPFAVMRAVIKYCYTAEIAFDAEVPPHEVLRVAHKYQITHLRDVCAEELCQSINDKNVPEMLRLAKKYEATALQTAAAKYLKENFDAVFPTVLETL